MSVLDVTQEVAWKFGEVHATLLDAGTTAPDLDLVSAAVPLTHNLTIVTHNTADFANIPGLTVADWLVSLR